MKKLLINLPKRVVVLIFICFILVCGQVWLELEMPEYMSKITMLVETPGSKIHDILHNGMSMVFCALFSLILSIIVGFLTSEISAKFSMAIRRNLFKKVIELDLEDIESFSVSSLVTRTTNDITQIQMIVSMGLQLILKAPIMAILVIIKLLENDWKWSLLTTICMMLITCIISAVVIIVSPKFRKMQKCTDDLNNVLKENLTGIHVVKAFDAENYEENKFEKINSELTDIQLKNQKSLAIKTPILYLSMYLIVLGIYFLGAYIIKNAFMVEKLAIYGDMIVFASYAMQIISIFLMLSNIISLLPRAEVSANRINEVLDKEIKMKSGNVKISKNNIEKIEFKNVSFKYSNSKENILNKVSFKINKGEKILILGNTGSGKTTLVNLILRFFDVSSGEILIDGVNIKDYESESLYKKMSYIPQKPIIFKDTLKNNIVYGSKNNTKIETAIDLIEEETNDKLLNQIISKNEINLSMGQKQKIAIARSILRKPEIYIFDDAFSGLDDVTEKDIIDRVKKHDNNATLILISENLKNYKLADKLLVLDKGNCVGFGTHEELIDSCVIYKEMFKQGGETI